MGKNEIKIALIMTVTGVVLVCVCGITAADENNVGKKTTHTLIQSGISDTLKKGPGISRRSGCFIYRGGRSYQFLWEVEGVHFIGRPNYVRDKSNMALRYANNLKEYLFGTEKLTRGMSWGLDAMKSDFTGRLDILDLVRWLDAGLARRK